MRLKVKAHQNSLLSSVSYRIGTTLVDPGDETEDFIGVKAVLITHAHFDHIYGLNRVIELNPEALVYTNASGRDALLDDRKNLSRYHEESFIFGYPNNIRIVEDGDNVVIENGVIAKAYFTPGHNMSCITWKIGENVFTGDSYIPGIKIVTSLPGGDKVLAKVSEELILSISVGKEIYPGHYEVV